MKRTFTLIELLVVIAIIALLIGSLQAAEPEPFTAGPQGIPLHWRNHSAAPAPTVENGAVRIFDTDPAKHSGIVRHYPAQPGKKYLSAITAQPLPGHENDLNGVRMQLYDGVTRSEFPALVRVQDPNAVKGE